MLHIDQGNLIKANQCFYDTSNISLVDIINSTKFDLKIIHLTDDIFRCVQSFSRSFGLPEGGKGKCKKWGYLNALDIEGESTLSAKLQAEYNHKNLKKTIKHIKDLIVMNPDLTCFITLTLNKEYIVRSDAENISEKLSNWIRNNAYTKGLKCIIIPELHRDGENIHMHGICNDGILKTDFDDVYRCRRPDKPDILLEKGMKIQKIKRKGYILDRPVYNLRPSWKWGNSTYERLQDNSIQIARYVTKYMTKELKRNYNPQTLFGKWFYSTRNLINKPIVELLDSPVPFHDRPYKIYKNEFSDERYKYWDNFDKMSANRTYE